MLGYAEGVKAFMLRMRPGADEKKTDRVPDGLASNEIIIGWSRAGRLLETVIPSVYYFTKILLHYYPEYMGNARSACSGGSSMWQFIREMTPGDLVLVPDDDGLFIARIESEPRWLESKVDEDTAFRRSVTWLNRKRPVLRREASDALQTRLRNPRTCLQITDLREDVLALIER